jgi:micrococcal nuclease
MLSIKIYAIIGMVALTGCTKVFSKNAPSMPISEHWDVVRVSDGDTITVRQGQREAKIRFCGIDSPEKAQPLGKEAKANLQRLVDEAGGKVTIAEIESDRYGRTVAEVFSSKNGIERSLNEEQLKSGYAYLYAAYAGKCPNKLAFENAEALAKSQKLGVWGGNYEKPWDYRKKERSQ